MNIEPLHGWDLATTEARDLQLQLACQVESDRPLGPWQTIAAADVSWNKNDTELYAAVVLVRAGSFELIERVGVTAPITFPYVPGLLSFRESPALLDAFRKLKTAPDVVLCDGHGRAHPRRFGVTCHLGLWLKRPTIGCAKSRLCGTHEEPGPQRGDWTPLLDQGETIGAVLRTRPRVRPLFISVGCQCRLSDAIEVVLATTGRYRMPEPARMAHAYVNEVRRAVKAGKPIPP